MTGDCVDGITVTTVETVGDPGTVTVLQRDSFSPLTSISTLFLMVVRH